MSSAGADCVMTLVEIEVGAGVGVRAHVLERDAARHLDEHTGGAIDARRTRRTSSGVMLSSSTMVAPAATASSHLLDAVALHLDRAARPPRRALGRTASRDAQAGEVVVLDQHEIGQRTAVVHAATGAHRRLLERRAARAASCGCPRSACGRRRRRRTGASRYATPERWQRKFSAVRSPVSTERSGPAT